MTVDEIIKKLALKPHPEGGHYRQTWVAGNTGRPVGTAIYYLLSSAQRSHWHKVDATEIWHYYAGAPLLLSQSATVTGPAENELLGPALDQGQAPQIIIAKNHWQAAETTGAYTLVGCTVCPGFDFSGFTLAPEGFHIPSA